MKRVKSDLESSSTVEFLPLCLIAMSIELNSVVFGLISTAEIVIDSPLKNLNIVLFETLIILKLIIFPNNNNLTALN